MKNRKDSGSQEGLTRTLQRFGKDCLNCQLGVLEILKSCSTEHFVQFRSANTVLCDWMTFNPLSQAQYILVRFILLSSTLWTFRCVQTIHLSRNLILHYYGKATDREILLESNFNILVFDLNELCLHLCDCDLKFIYEFLLSFKQGMMNRHEISSYRLKFKKVISATGMASCST